MKNLKQLIFASLILLFASSTLATQKLTLVLDWFANPDQAPIFVAKQQGFFQQAGLDVHIIAPADPADGPKMVAVGKADIAIDYQPSYMMAVAEGLPLTQVGTLIATPLDCLVVLKSSNIKSIKDLKGKTIAYSDPATDFVTLKSMLKENDMSLKDVKLVDVKYNLTQALLAKKVDAAIGLMRNFELIQLQLAGEPGRAFYPEDYGMPSYSELIFVVNKKQAKSEKIQKFLFAVSQGVQYLVNHPETSWQTFAKNHPILNNQLNKQAWFATLSRFALRPAARDKARCLALANYLEKNLDLIIPGGVCN